MKKSAYRVLKVWVKPSLLDLAVGILFQHGISSLEQKSQAKKILITAELPAHQARISRALKAASGPEGEKLFDRLEIAKIKNLRWAEAYKNNLKPFPLAFRCLKDRKHPERALLWIDPRGGKSAKKSDSMLHLEAGLAFGTGSHPTTQLCAQLLAEALLQSKTGKVLDLGCGTGLLAMIAAKLGIRKVWAIDNDPVALDVARENFAKNSTRTIRLGADLKKSPKGFDVVVANILLTTLLELKAPLLSRLGKRGLLIVSGLLYKDCAELIRSYQKAGLKLALRRNQKGWSALVFRKT